MNLKDLLPTIWARTPEFRPSIEKGGDRSLFVDHTAKLWPKNGAAALSWSGFLIFLYIKGRAIEKLRRALLRRFADTM